jgi:ferritin-like metal-binding protein YciE
MRHITMDEQAEALFVTGLRNAHALEAEAEQIIGRQLERLINYRQLAERLRAHLDETRMQKERLERMLTRYSASPSSLKETATTLMGNMAAIAHTTAPDEVLKNTFANVAFENFEIAAYRSLIAMAETYGQRDAVGLLRQSLAEEERMARWLDENVAEITREFMTLRAHSEKADR